MKTFFKTFTIIALFSCAGLALASEDPKGMEGWRESELAQINPLKAKLDALTEDQMTVVSEAMEEYRELSKDLEADLLVIFRKQEKNSGELYMLTLEKEYRRIKVNFSANVTHSIVAQMNARLKANSLTAEDLEALYRKEINVVLSFYPDYFTREKKMKDTADACEASNDDVRLMKLCASWGRYTGPLLGEVNSKLSESPWVDSTFEVENQGHLSNIFEYHGGDIRRSQTAAANNQGKNSSDDERENQPLEYSHEKMNVENEPNYSMPYYRFTKPHLEPIDTRI